MMDKMQNGSTHVRDKRFFAPQAAIAIASEMGVTFELHADYLKTPG
jgi:hypothetical protein